MSPGYSILISRIKCLVPGGVLKMVVGMLKVEVVLSVVVTTEPDPDSIDFRRFLVVVFPADPVMAITFRSVNV